MTESADGAVLAAGAETENTQSLRDNDALLLVVRRRNTLEDLQALHSSSTAGGLVGNHAADSLVQDAGRSAEVEGTTTSRVETGDLAEVGVVLDYCGGEKKTMSAVCYPDVRASKHLHILPIYSIECRKFRLLPILLPSHPSSQNKQK